MPNTQPIELEQQTLEHGVTLVKITGEIDFSNSPQLRAGLLQVLEGKPHRLVLDLSGVPYMDSSGVATLVEALQIQRQRNHRLILCQLQQRLQGIFDIARLNTVFTIVDDVQAAYYA